jgi:hypothetical protein
MRNKNFKNDILDNILYIAVLVLIACFVVFTAASSIYA